MSRTVLFRNEIQHFSSTCENINSPVVQVRASETNDLAISFSRYVTHLVLAKENVKSLLNAMSQTGSKNTRARATIWSII